MFSAIISNDFTNDIPVKGGEEAYALKSVISQNKAILDKLGSISCYIRAINLNSHSFNQELGARFITKMQAFSIETP